MKKTILSIGAVLIGAALIAPNPIGQSAERNIKSMIETIDAHPAYSAEVKSYTRGWFSADAVVEFSAEFPMPQADGSKEMVALSSGDMTLAVQHGPVLTQYDAGVGAVAWQLLTSDESKRTELSWDENKPLYQLTGSMGLTGNGSYQDQIADVQYKNIVQDLVVSINGYQGSGTFDSEGFAYQGSSEQILFGSPSDSFSVNQLALSTEGKGSLLDVLNARLLESDFALTIGQVTSNDTRVLERFAVDGKSVASADGETIDITMDSSVAQLLLPNGEASDLVMNIAINNFDVEFMQAYQQLVNNTYGQPQAVVQEQLTALFKQYREQVLGAEPEFAITKLSGTLPNGQFVANASMSMAPVEQLPQGEIPPQFWIQHMLADGAVEADKAVVRTMLTVQLSSVMAQQMPNLDPASPQFKAMIEQQVDQVIKVYLQQGFLTEQDGQYQSQFELKQGTLTMNGKPIPLM